MTKYKYSPSARFVYRYSNIIATLLLSFHALVSFSALWLDWVNIFPLIINILLLLLLNRFFFKVYKYFPFTVEIDNEKIICSDFFLSKKIFEIRLIDIDKIEGGIFSNRPTSPIYISCSKQNINFGFFPHLGDFSKLITIILSNLKTELYNSLMENMKKHREELKNIKPLKKKKK